KVPLIGVGGVQSGDDAVRLLKAGANLVQLYTGLIYKGPRLVRDIKEVLARS
ncbi:MAG: quinone-dependent dihydroorotate dehydrogenase, partial [Alphaproteobacteria bacterium]|nr:quinone-dependent dihydroorotate dehydrogenase [Alphaproteobacteria bacterium]